MPYSTHLSALSPSGASFTIKPSSISLTPAPFICSAQLHQDQPERFGGEGASRAVHGVCKGEPKKGKKRVASAPLCESIPSVRSCRMGFRHRSPTTGNDARGFAQRTGKESRPPFSGSKAADRSVWIPSHQGTLAVSMGERCRGLWWSVDRMDKKSVSRPSCRAPSGTPGTGL